MFGRSSRELMFGGLAVLACYWYQRREDGSAQEGGYYDSSFPSAIPGGWAGVAVAAGIGYWIGRNF